MKQLWLDGSALRLTEAGRAQARTVPPGTVLVLTRGMTLLKDLPVCIAGTEVAFNQDVKALLPAAGIDSGFLAYQLIANKHEILDLVDTAGHGTGRLDTDLLKEFKVAIAPIKEQERVRKLLAAWDAAIATTEHLLVNSLEQKQGLLGRLLLHGRRANAKQHSWSFVDFDEVFERVSRKNTEGNANVLTISGVQGLVNQRDYFKKSVASADLTGYTLLRQGEFAYNKSYSANYPMGAIKQLTRYPSGVVSSLYLCFRFREGIEVDADFFRHYFDAGVLDDGLAGIAQEGARNHGLLNVPIGDFFKLRLHIPGVETQRRIAIALNMAEREQHLIKTQIAHLRAEKSALMQQLLTGKRRMRLPAPTKAVSA
jgi:type I restriction enzyme S subunit